MTAKRLHMPASP